MVTWIIVKRLTGGIMDGIVVTDRMSADGSLGAPFKAGQFVRSCAGSNYTVVSCDLA